MRSLSLILLASILVSTNSQSWTGTYTVQSGCNTNTCCCLTKTVTVTRPSTNKLKIESDVAGNCGGQSKFLAEVAEPKGYTTLTEIGGNSFNITLSSDSRTVNVINLSFPTCSGKGVKNGAVKQHLSIGIILAALILFERVMNFSKI